MQLKRRLLTAVVLISAVIWCVLSLPTNVIAALFALIVLAGAWEWSRLVPLSSLWTRTAYIVLMVPMLWWFWWAELGHEAETAKTVLLIACGWWIFALAWVFNPGTGSGTGPLTSLGKGLAGVLTLVPAWLSLWVMHGFVPAGPLLVLCLFAIVWAADSGAFFAGSRWGRRRLADRVSPGKTWEGVFGGLTAGGIVGLLAGWLMGWSGLHLIQFVLICLAAVSFSVVGDLTESLLKRHRGLKDSGHLLPGHGGILDRIDSLTAAAPVFLLGVLWTDL